MVQVEMSNTCIDMSANKGSEKWTEKTLRLETKRTKTTYKTFEESID